MAKDDEIFDEQPAKKGFSIPGLFNTVKDSVLGIWDNLSDQVQKIVKIASIALLGIILLLIIISLIPKSSEGPQRSNDITKRPADSKTLDTPKPRNLDITDLSIPDVPNLITKGNIVPAFLPKTRFSGAEVDAYRPDFMSYLKAAIKRQNDAEEALILAESNYLLK